MGHFWSKGNIFRGWGLSKMWLKVKVEIFWAKTLKIWKN
jgi:hypothetical protein